MKLLSQNLPESEVSPQAIQETPSSDQDSLIAHGLQKEQYIGIVALAIALVAAVGFFSRRVEDAIVLALVLSAILIAVSLFL